ncbi:MAG: TolC family protein, partial [Gallionellaceae bacterium]|nr:TolC family protein [Gallionellaceae bacterium]
MIKMFLTRLAQKGSDKTFCPVALPLAQLYLPKSCLSQARMFARPPAPARNKESTTLNSTPVQTALKHNILCFLCCCFIFTGAKAEPLKPSHATIRGNKSVALTAAQPLTITLSDAIVLGLRRNRTIRSAYLGRISDKFSLRVVENSFNPQLALNGSYTANHDPTGNSRTAEVTPTATLTSKIGTQFSLSWANQTGSVSDPLGTGSALDTQIADNTLSTRSQVATLSVTQPLLRGAGYKIATAPLRQARLDELANKLTLKSSVSDTVTNIISAYYELLRAQEQLKIARDG